MTEVLVEQPDKPKSLLWAIAKISGIGLAVVASLLTFPEYIPVMAIGWVVCQTVNVIRGGSGLLPALAFGGVLLVKGGLYSTPLVALAILMLIASLLTLAARHVVESTKKAYVAATATAHFFVWLTCYIAVVEMAGVPRVVRTKPEVDPDRPIVCIGDSITSGTPPHGDYPSVLEKEVVVEVLNYGKPGISTDHAVLSIDKVRAVNPQAIVIEIGGHDFMNGESRESVYDNIEQFIKVAEEIKAVVVLFEIPRGLVRDPFYGMERELARHRNIPVQLIHDGAIRSLVFFGPDAPPGRWLAKDQRLSYDGIHPTRLGNEMLANRVAEALERAFGSAILK